MFKNSIKGYLMALATLSLTACGGGGGGSESTSGNSGGTKPPTQAFKISTAQAGGNVLELSSFSFDVSSSGGTGSASYAAEVKYDNFSENAISASINGSKVSVNIADLEYSGDFTLTITGTDSAGSSDNLTISFNAENTSAQPILAELNAMFESKYDIANLKEERDVLVKVAKAAYYASDSFNQSNLDAAMEIANQELDTDKRQLILDLLEGKFYNENFSTNSYYSESDLNAALKNIKGEISEYMMDVNGAIFTVAQDSGDVLEPINLNGELFITDNKASQFFGNSLFMDTDTKQWKNDYRYLEGAIDPTTIVCSAG
jgi:hypothetical protein